MELLQTLLESSNFPILSALILGLMTAISPCPLATNITAIAFIGKDIKNKHKVFTNGLLYTLGRAISYVTLGIILYFGTSQFRIALFLQSNGEKFLGPLLLIIGILMLDIVKVRFPELRNISDRLQKSNKKDNSLISMLIGVLFALAFCPYSGVLYFGILIPLTISSTSGLILPFVFAIATGLPVIVFAYLIAYTLSSVGKLYNHLKIFEFWFRRIVSAIFSLTGVYYIYIFFIQ